MPLTPDEALDVFTVALGGLARACERADVHDTLGVSYSRAACVWVTRAEARALAALDDYPLVLKPLIDELRNLDET